MFISALIDVAGHAGKVDAAFEILQEARAKGMHVGIISYSSLMGACSKVLTYYSRLKHFLANLELHFILINKAQEKNIISTLFAFHFGF